MFTYQIKPGSTDVSVTVRFIDSADGTPETGVDHATTGIDMKYRRTGAAAVDITEASLAALTSAHADGGMEQIGQGYVRLDLPDAAVASGAAECLVFGTATGMVCIGCVIQLEAATNSIYSDTTIATSKTTQIYSDTTIIYSDTTIATSKTTQIYSDTTIIYSDTTRIHSDTTVIEAGGGSLTAAQDSKLTRVNSKSTQIYSDTAIIYSDTTIATSKTTQIYSDTTIAVSKATQIYSDTAIASSKAVQIYSDTTKIHSDTTVIEAAGASTSPDVLVATTIATLATQTSFTLTAGSADNDAYNNCAVIFVDASTSTQKAISFVLDYVGSTKTVTLDAAPIFTIATTDNVYIMAAGATAAADSKLTRINSKSTQIYSDTAIIYSDTTIATSKTTQIYSDTAIASSKVVQIYSDSTIIYSDTTRIHSDTTHIDSDTTHIESDAVRCESKAVQIYSDTTIVTSKTTQIYSDTTIATSKTTQIYSDTTAIHTQTTAASSKAVQIYSDTTAIHSDTTAIQTKTDSLTFTQAGHVDANVQRINDVTITGDGQVGTEFGV